MSETGQPVLRVVRGNPTAEEVAALVAVLAAVGSSTDADPPGTPTRGWSSPAARLRSPSYGTRAGGWRASALPR